MWQDKPFSFGHAWIDLLISANIKDTKFVKRSQVIEVKRGQIAISTKGFADRWGWSRGKVDRFLKQLENEHQIEHQKSNVTTLITILNYDDYNGTDTKTNTEQTPNEHRTDTSKEVKEVKEVKKETLDQYEEASLRMKDTILELFPAMRSLYDFEFVKWREYRQGKKPVLDLNLNLMDWMKRAAGKIPKEPEGLKTISKERQAEIAAREKELGLA
jgi:hypothetical protein